MNREDMIAHLSSHKGTWDVIVIGGGATGAGVALDSASRGFKTLLVEGYDFGKGTSSRSTKLIHGGVRYLQQGNMLLVKEALHERAILLQNAPHLVYNRDFVVPYYSWWEGPFYGIGLKLYDLLSGKHSFGNSKHLSTEETISCLPTIQTVGLQRGIKYHDGQFDDSRLLINLLQTAVEFGATVVNYMPVIGLIHSYGKISGVRILDREKGKEFELKSRSVINATGVFTDDILKMDDSKTKPLVQTSQGIHLVLSKDYLASETALMIPRTKDGRVLFALPWRDRVILGTTDTPIDTISVEPRPLAEEIDFLLEHTAIYLNKAPTRDDILCVFAGLRPLVNQKNKIRTSTISREHCLYIARSGLITITGGKWTTYRKMAEDTVNQTIKIAELPYRPCITRSLKIHGYPETTFKSDRFKYYGEDAIGIIDLLKKPDMDRLFHPHLPFHACEVIWAVRNEMARTIEDVLARRTRSLILNAKASVEIAEDVARVMAKEMSKSEEWINSQVTSYTHVAEGYFVK